MTPEQIDAITNTGLWIHDQVTVYGPGLTLAAAGWIAWHTVRRIHRRLKHTARHIDTLLATTHDTQPGTDDQLLNACWNAWNTDATDTGTDTRKEKP